MLLVTSTVAACGLPRTGPNKNEIFSGSVDRRGDAYIVEVDDRVARATSDIPPLAFGDGFRNAGVLGSDTISPGDTLGLTIWENVDDGLLVPTGANAQSLEQVQVDGSGFIFVPYAGRIRAAGNTPETVRRLITEKLETQTPDPQVQVQRLAGDGATVSIIGGVGAQGVYAIERPTRTLTAMLARAGGVSIPSEIAQVTVIRGDHQGSVWLEDLYTKPGLDIAMRAGDRILVEEDSRFFTALGATGAQAKVPFDTQEFSAVEAIGRVGGLNSQLADPTGVFVFRDESEEVARAVLGRDDLVGDQRVVYVLDLSKPNGVFVARDFVIRTGDTVYVTEAPYTQFSKVLNALTGPLGTVSAVETVTN
ncbi:MAG: polysaccharide biosynthesis/export family protein [Paracoccaceae bacterium]|nr:polysaccharide biosynthesis/export family protein [Paracoccaceae bacterium]